MKIQVLYTVWCNISGEAAGDKLISLEIERVYNRLLKNGFMHEKRFPR